MNGKVAVGAALQYAQQVLGGPIVENETVVSVPNSVTVLAKGNGDRVALVVVNLGATDVLIGISSDVSANKGILLSANGGNVALTVVYDFTLVSRQWNAIGSSAGPVNVYVLEMSRFTLTPKE